MDLPRILLAISIAIAFFYVYRSIKNTPLEYEIKSLIDLDFYKLTMAQFIWKYFPKVQVTLAFKNRHTHIPLAEYKLVDETNRQFSHICQMHNGEDVISYLARLKGRSGKNYFEKGFLRFFKNIQLPMPTVHTENGQLNIEVTGNWVVVTIWETFIMSVVNALYVKALMKKRGVTEKTTFAEGLKRLRIKIDILLAHPDIKFIHFGTRRRAYRKWDIIVHKTLTEAFGKTGKQFLGTSNVHLAMELGLTPVGTFAHELFMVVAAINSAHPKSLRMSQRTILVLWEEMYGPDLLTALSDTFGTVAFFKDFKEFAVGWAGVRHDSGDPFVFGRKIIEYYNKLGIDPKTKIIVYSDGLDIEVIVALWNEFHGQINLLFGWGTNLSNDIGFDAISIVVKPIMAREDENAQWFICCKLTDNIQKAICGTNDEELKKQIIEFYMLVFEYGEFVDIVPTY